MNQAEATHYARLLEQYQDVLVFIMATQDASLRTVPVGQLAQQLNIGNPLAGAIYGFCTLAIVHSYDWIAEPEQFPASIVGAIDVNAINPGLNRIGNGETREVACFRHLRNCFAHGNFEFPQPGTTTIHIWDKNPAGVPTFDAVCDAAAVLAPIALGIMRASRAYAVANAAPAAAAPAAPAAAAPAAAAPGAPAAAAPGAVAAPAPAAPAPAAPVASIPAGTK